MTVVVFVHGEHGAIGLNGDGVLTRLQACFVLNRVPRAAATNQHQARKRKRAHQRKNLFHTCPFYSNEAPAFTGASSV